MIGIDLTESAVEDALVGIARHVPADVEIGRPLMARTEPDGGVQVATTLAWWWLEPEGTAVRLLPLDGDRAELTRWRDGAEVLRILNID